MENLTYKQAQNKMRKIAKSYDLKLKFSTCYFGYYCEVLDLLSNHSSDGISAPSEEHKDFTNRLQTFLKNEEVQAFRKEFKIYGLGKKIKT